MWRARRAGGFLAAAGLAAAWLLAASAAVHAGLAADTGHAATGSPILFLLQAVVLGVASLALAVSTSFPVSLLLMVPVGAGGIAMAATANATIQLNVPEQELAKRRAGWKQPKPKYNRGLLAKYIRLVSTASRGAVTDGFSE